MIAMTKRARDVKEEEEGRDFTARVTHGRAKIFNHNGQGGGATRQRSEEDG